VTPFFAVALLLAAPENPSVFTLDEFVPISAAMSRGSLLGQLDRAGAVAAGDLRAKLGAGGELPANWVAEADGKKRDSFIVTYFGEGPGAAGAWYSARVAKGKLVSSQVFPAQARPPLTPAQQRLAAALAVARGQAGLRPCTDAPFEAIAVPPEAAAGPIDVYLLTRPVRPGVYPLGGHYLVRVSADGRVVSTRAFAPTCLDAVPEARPGEKSPILAVADPVDSTPTEIHFYLSNAYHLAVEVSTAGLPRRWIIEGDKMRLESR
jgi:hypothetical protein